MASSTHQGSVSDTNLLASITSFAQRWLTLPIYDASHSWPHTQRVLALSHHILSASNSHHPTSSSPLNPTLISLTALLHDVADRKYFPAILAHPTLIIYLLPNPTLSPSALNPEVFAKTILGQYGASLETANSVQEIINALSYSAEIKAPEVTRETLVRYPELGIVQDADRLDALGAIGIARTFTYGGAVEGRLSGSRLQLWKDGPQDEAAEPRGLEDTLHHFEEKLERLEGMMKTEEGRRLASVRTERLRIFRGWWEEEVWLAGGETES